MHVAVSQATLLLPAVVWAAFLTPGRNFTMVRVRKTKGRKRKTAFHPLSRKKNAYPHLRSEAVEPANVKLVCEYVASLLNKDVSAIASITTNNVINLYKLDI